MSKPATNNLTDIELKDHGNKLFSAKKFEDAITCYSKAIIKNPNNATYFTNRALCYIKLKKFDLACQDCRRALDMDQNLIKGHFFLGLSLMELQSYDEAIKHLQRAQDLGKEQKLNFGDDIASQLRMARKKRWNLLEEKRIAQEIELQTYLNQLIKEDMEKRLEKLKIDDKLSEDLHEEECSKIEQQCENYTTELNNMFVKVDDRRRKREVPDFICGKISFEILQDPVITPSGITYERKDIEEHLQRVGHFDPVTRVPLSVEQLIPNFSMKEVVDTFIQENEWALEY
ncbi:CLUMA_CG000084, isoform A [Clunio marinus]|uniref:E3 ubiquitin-protein ligase CHIP n=1 Tax=Clunio marinus TaxID=568069 RepID=A0A1J1HJC2_9DIPT|nr:CLUMA_CG000084, isoform A [Clunio marinus]